MNGSQTTMTTTTGFTLDIGNCELYDFNGYVLALDWLGQTDSMGKCRMAYQLMGLDNQVIFEGDDFCASPMHSCDGIESALDLMGFLTLRKGDTDQDYFDSYTPQQLEFSEQNAEELQCLVMELEELCNQGDAEKAWEMTLADDRSY